MSYTRVMWKDKEQSATTPLNAYNLNVMDKGIADLDEEVNSLMPLKEELSKEIKDRTESDNKLSNRINNLVIHSGDSNPEVVDARVDPDGKVYSTLKDRIDADTTKLSDNLNDGWIKSYNIANPKDSMIGFGWSFTPSTNASQVLVDVKPNTAYTISYEDSSYTPYNFGFCQKASRSDATRINNVSNWLIDDGVAKVKSFTITTTATTNVIALDIRNQSGIATQSQIDSFKMQIVEGETALPYQPYNGESNRVITEKLSENDEWLKSKNLADKTRFVLGQWSASATMSATTTRLSNTSDYKKGNKLQSGKKYTLSAQNIINSAVLFVFDSNGSVLKSVPTWANLPITIDGVDGYLVYSLRNTDNRNLDVSTDYKVQLEESDNATPYKPFAKSNVEITEDISELFKIKSKQLGTSKTVSSGYFELVFNVKEDNYTAVAVSYWNLNDRGLGGKVHITAIDLNSTDNTVRMYGSVSSSVTFSDSAIVGVLYIKNVFK